MATLTQENRQLSLYTPLGENVLLLSSIRGTESMSNPFRFELDMVSENFEIAAEQVVGLPIVCSFPQRDGSSRFIHGVVSRFSGGAAPKKVRRYFAEVVPWLWLLDQTSDCRIFQNKTVISIITQVFDDLGFNDYDISGLTGTGAAAVAQRTLEYCVQYRETDFEFVSRLMEEHGLFYFFRHESDRHVLCLCDDVQAYSSCCESAMSLVESDEGDEDSEAISDWSHAFRLGTSHWAHVDFNFQTPTADLLTSEKSLVAHNENVSLERFDFPGRFDNRENGRQLVRLRMEADETEANQMRGKSRCKSLCPGGTFSIEDAKIPAESGQRYVVTSVTHQVNEPLAYEVGVEVEFHYRNSFECIPEQIIYRPRQTTRKPVVHGLQTAIVVGPPGEELWTDELGRVKVQFPWDREGQGDEKSSCWMRVSQTHAGNGWGAIHIPRIGEEVLIAFLEGDPDRPLITGRVYNGNNRPPFDLPAEKHVSGYRSCSTPGSEGFNEFTFHDNAGEEMIRVHAQKDQQIVIENDNQQNVGNDERLHVEHDRIRQVGNDETVTVKGNKTDAVGKIMTGYAREKIHLVAGDEITLQVGKSTLHMNKSGQILLEGTQIDIRASESYRYVSDSVSGQAITFHEFKGAVVEYNVD